MMEHEKTYFENLEFNPRDPDPWLAMYLDKSLPLRDSVKAALLSDTKSWSRQFFLPLVRPLARLSMVLIQIVKVFIPNKFTSSFALHRLLFWGLKYFVSPTANYLVLRHFNIGSEILEFISRNAEGVQTIPLHPLKPLSLEAVKDDLFLQHDLNLYNFIIRLNTALNEKGLTLKPVEQLNYDMISESEIAFEPFPNRWLNFVDLQTAIEVFTPVYQLFLTDNDFWRATNSLQLDETVGIYAATILGAPNQLYVVNNKHPLVPLITISAGFRLVLHGLASETLHALLVRKKREQRAAAVSEAAAT
jgi:hypothetical protein